jgi:signal transduction histidine kinase
MWGAAAILAKIFSSVFALHLRRTGISSVLATRLVGALMVFLAVEGMAWGSLGWATLDTASVGGSVFVIATSAAIAGSSMSAFSPILPVYLVFSAAVMLTLAAKLLLVADAAYHAIGVMSALYTPLLYLQARDSANAARTAIELRFENIDLVKQLRMEKENAQRAHREADTANLSKSKFLAAASHDLRQPIHAQGLFLELLVPAGFPSNRARFCRVPVPHPRRHPVC